ncbi:MAG: PIN domain nuclease [Actinobacteria bacterium]|jgi:predicted nucleic acid-binding protein|nr:PIN domain nuclease [Actinomycetota bacterium]
MLIADTSVWIDFLKGSRSPQATRMRQAISNREVIVVDPILLEVMSGARSSAVAQTQRLLEAQHLEALFPKLDWLDAATIYRELRWRGVTIRSQIDALIAAVAIRLDVPVLHHDRDYEHITRHTSLRTVKT